MTILSIQFHSHDTSVALVKDGKVLYAASNERFSRIKMDRGFPDKVLKNCLEFTKISPKQIDKVVIIGEKLFPRSFFEIAHLFTMEFLLTRGKNLFWSKNLFYILRSIMIPLFFIPAYFYKDIFPLLRLKSILRDFKGNYIFVPHHSAHLYSAYYPSGWNECLATCFEGSGRLKAMSVYHVRNNYWFKITECSIPNSAGMFYGLCTYILGFKPLRHEGKITGLSAYGDPKQAYKQVSKLFRVEGLQFKLDFRRYLRMYTLYKTSQKLTAELKKFKKEDIAAAFQKRLEDCVLEIIKKILKECKMDKIALAGGVMANVKLNQKIFELPSIKEIFIYPAMGDDGVALGAALYVGYQIGNRSILSQATDPKINDILNKKLKRTEFMPFAPVTLKEYAGKCFKNLTGAYYTAKFMTITFNCSDYMKKVSPAVVHVDGTARPQILAKSDNPSYYKTLKEYYKITKIPTLINTSFNIHEEPIVCSPDDAVRAFLSGKLDYLAIGNYLVKNESL